MRSISLIEMERTPWLLRRGINRKHTLNRKHTRARAKATAAAGTRWLPVYKHMVIPESTPMPLYLLYRLIDEAGYRAVFNECLCRKGAKCRHYPLDIGCLMLGETPLPPGPHSHGIDNLFHEATAEEAWGLVCRAVKAGLVPSVGHNSADSFVHGIGPRDRRVAVCFCCDCCCVTRYERFVPLESLTPAAPRLEGISVEITDDCIGCGVCVNHCYMKAIRIIDKKAVRSEYCRACGRCADACPQEAIRVVETDPGFLEKSLSRLRGPA